MNIKKFEKRKRLDFEKEKKLRELKEEYGIEEIPSTKRMFQYSKILTTVICIFTLLINAVYFFALTPMSGSWGITDAAMEYSASVLKIWDAGTIIFFCGYFAKALFETKFENQTNAESLIDSVTDRIKDTLGG